MLASKDEWFGSKDELRARSISTWRRVQVAGALVVLSVVVHMFGIVPLVVTTLVFMLSGIFVGASLVMTLTYRFDLRSTVGNIGGLNRRGDPFLRLIIREEIK